MSFYQQNLKRKRYEKFLEYISFEFFTFLSLSSFLLRFKFLSISRLKSDTCCFCSQVKSSQCWNWNLIHHKFWEDSRSSKVTPKKIFVLVLILLRKIWMAWRWSCNCGSLWKLHPKDWYNFNNIPRMWNVSVCVSRIAVQWQIEVRECLLSFGTECFVLQFAFQKKNKAHDTQNCNFCCWFVLEWNWSLKFRLRMSKNWVLRLIIGPEKDDVTRGGEE